MSHFKYAAHFHVPIVFFQIKLNNLTTLGCYFFFVKRYANFYNEILAIYIYIYIYIVFSLN